MWVLNNNGVFTMTALKIKIWYERQYDNGGYQQYIFHADCADVGLQGLGLKNNRAIAVGSPDSAPLSYATFADAMAAYLITGPAQVISDVNSVLGTSYTVGELLSFDENLDAALVPVYGSDGNIISRSAEYVATKNISGGAGQVVFQLTDDATSTGNALFPNGIDFIKAEISDNSKGYNYSYTLTNSNKTLTITAKYFAAITILTTISVLAGVTTNAADTTSVMLHVKGRK
jgi:hypothetical protein